MRPRLYKHGKGHGDNPLGYALTSREARRRIAFGKGSGASLSLRMQGMQVQLGASNARKQVRK